MDGGGGGRGRPGDGVGEGGGRLGDIILVRAVKRVPSVVGKGVAVVEEVGGDPVKRDVLVREGREGHLVGVQDSQLQY